MCRNVVMIDIVAWQVRTTVLGALLSLSCQVTIMKKASLALLLYSKKPDCYEK